jgi:hypothetical protein
MNKEQAKNENGQKNDPEQKGKDVLQDCHEDLNEFRETKKTINDLLNYRMSLLDMAKADKDKINEFKGKAIEAINHLFDEQGEKKSG